MCIRDRLYTDQTFLKFAVELAEKFNIVMLSLSSHCSHGLQPLDISFFKSLKSGWDDATDSLYRMYPVSYTHLDVYKRQTHNIVSFFDPCCYFCYRLY